MTQMDADKANREIHEVRETEKSTTDGSAFAWPTADRRGRKC